MDLNKREKFVLEILALYLTSGLSDTDIAVEFKRIVSTYADGL